MALVDPPKRLDGDGVGFTVECRHPLAKGFELGGRQPAEQPPEELGIELADTLERGCAGRSQRDLLLAAIRGILVPLEVAVLDQKRARRKFRRVSNGELRAILGRPDPPEGGRPMGTS